MTIREAWGALCDGKRTTTNIRCTFLRDYGPYRIIPNANAVVTEEGRWRVEVTVCALRPFAQCEEAGCPGIPEEYDVGAPPDAYNCRSLDAAVDAVLESLNITVVDEVVENKGPNFAFTMGRCEEPVTVLTGDTLYIKQGARKRD